MATRTRVLVWDMSTMMREIIRQLLKESNFEVTVLGDGPPTLVQASKKYMPDVIVTSLAEDGADIAYRDLLLECPRVKVLDVRNDGRTGYLYELCPERKPLEEISPESLVTTIRKAVLPLPVRGEGSFHPPRL